MRLVTLSDGTPDGRVAVVASDGTRALELHPAYRQLLDLLCKWEEAAEALQLTHARVEAGEGQLISVEQCCAPLPRTWQWLDGSVYPTHAELMQIAFGLDPINTDRPLMYQGMSDRFYAPNEDVRLPSEGHGIDFEGEFGVIVDHVPMGTPVADALEHIKLVVQINDWSLRAIAPVEMKTGFGWVQAKPACSMAPFAVTPDELGDAWRDGRVCLDLHINWNGRPFGRANGQPMLFGFAELIAHAALTRDLVAGTVIGSGTVSNSDYRDVGSSCISEVRAIEIIESGKAKTDFMRFGDRVRMEARARDGTAPFGAIDQKVVKA